MHSPAARLTPSMLLEQVLGWLICLTNAAARRRAAVTAMTKRRAANEVMCNCITMIYVQVDKCRVPASPPQFKVGT